MTNLADIMSSVSSEMQANLKETRSALSHNLSKGEAVEETVREFLRRHLPTSLGVVSGQIVDSQGSMSRQMDVIIYDAARTPSLFISKSGGIHVVPSEGVIAAVEVKTKLTLGQIDSVMENMKSVKTLDKSAFINTDMVIQHTVNLFGQELAIFPTLYFEGYSA